MNSNNEKLAYRAKNLIPGGAHTYSKGDDQFPSNAPKIIDYGLGCNLWDVDKNKYKDFAMSLGSVILGHAYKPIIDAVKKELSRGVNFCRPSRIEGDLAEILTDIIPSAEMVKFGKNGSDAVTAAIKVARGYTARKYIARCSADPFNAIHDWFIGSTVMNRGVPKDIQNLTLQFEYNSIESCKKLFSRYPNDIACFVLEPISLIEPKENFLNELKKLCEANGALLIFDEVVSGFRFDIGGVQNMIGVTPHLSAFGKAMANGFSVSALVGQREFMSIGGLNHDSERLFLLSSTHGGETHSLAAAIATINEINKQGAISHFSYVGKKLKEGIKRLSVEVGVEKFVDIVGYDVKPALIFKNHIGEICNSARTLFMRETVKKGLLMPYIVPSLAHKDKDIEFALNCIGDAFVSLKKASDYKGFDEAINEEPIKPVFRKFN